jgi:hypothetical protein
MKRVFLDTNILIDYIQARAQLLCLQNEKLPLSAEHALEMVSFC